MRREHGSVVCDVIDAIDRAEGREDPPRLTHLAVDANIPHDRLLRYLRELRNLGLVGPDEAPRLTPRGRQMLQHYRHWLRAQAEFGLVGGEADQVTVVPVAPPADPTARAGRR